jgi:Tfp pilus assembly protein PilV
MNRTAQGFSAIEALVAVAIMAVALIPLFELQRQTVLAHERQTALYDEASATEDALILLRDLNPTLQPSGSLQLAGGRVQWSSTPISAATETRRTDPNGRAYMVRRYLVDVVVTSAAAEQRAVFSVEKIGWGGPSEPSNTVSE